MRIAGQGQRTFRKPRSDKVREIMKIDEACINHTALRLINEIVGCPYEYAEQDKNADHCRLMTLGEVRGVLEMTEAMKKVLSVEQEGAEDE